MPLTNEFDVIRNIKKVLGKPSSRVIVGIGDDAAVTRPPKGHALFTIDTMVEGVHFDLAYMTARELGHKALAVNLSDIAAMGGTPDYALVSLGLKQDVSEHFVEELYEGIRALAKRFKVDVIGGNLVQSPQSNVIDIALIGSANKYLTRAGANAGDLLVVTGSLGASAAGLNVLRKLGRYEVSSNEKIHRPLIAAHLTPEPRVAEALKLSQLGGVTSMIDISDGFAKEVHHLAEQSKVGFKVREKDLPIRKEVGRAAEILGTQGGPWALYGGEDYELLFTVAPSAWNKIRKAFARSKVPLTVIGEATAAQAGVQIQRRDDTIESLEPRGWNHFVKRRPATPLTLG